MGDVVMSKNEYFLSREDLIEAKRSVSINEITLYDFKTSVLSLKKIQKADLIVFVESLYDGRGTHCNSHRVLKDRKGNYLQGLSFADKPIIV